MPATTGDRDVPMASAQVLLRSMSGKRITGDLEITARNIAEYQPSPTDTEVAQRAFQAAGFEVGPLVGISFAVTAPVPTFERFFAATIGMSPRGGLDVLGADGRRSLELPLNGLAPALAERVVAVTFTPPAELFGMDEP